MGIAKTIAQARKLREKVEQFRAEQELAGLLQIEPRKRPDRMGVPFEMFWELYDKNWGKLMAERTWKRLSWKDQQAAIKGVKPYVESTPDKKFRLAPEKYIRQRKWMDEIIPHVKRKANAWTSEPAVPSKPMTPQKGWQPLN